MARHPVKQRKPLQQVSEHMEEGGLHRALGVAMGKKIPKAMLAVHEGDSPKLKRQKNLAKTFAKYRP